MGKWLSRWRSLWHGEATKSRFDNRLEQLARRRETEAHKLESRVVRTTTTARWWRRFR